MSRKRWLIGFSVGGLAALLIATAITFADWRLNPGGIFHDSSGTDWRIVWETWFSWFLPVFALVAGIAIVVLWWLSARAGKSAE